MKTAREQGMGHQTQQGRGTRSEVGKEVGLEK